MKPKYTFPKALFFINSLAGASTYVGAWITFELLEMYMSFFSILSEPISPFIVNDHMRCYAGGRLLLLFTGEIFDK